MRKKIRTGTPIPVCSDHRQSCVQILIIIFLMRYAGSGREKNVSGTGAKNILSFNGLDDKEEADRIYTAKVSVYKVGAAEKNFPKEDLIVSLDGAKED